MAQASSPDKIIDMGNGQVVQFPGDMSDSDINNILNKQNTAKQSSDGTTVSSAPEQVSGPLGWAQRAGSGLVKGAAMTLGAPGSLVDLGTKYVENPLRAGLGFPPVPKGANPLPNMSEMLTLTGAAGLTDRADAVPGFGANPSAERYVDATATGLGAALPGIAMGAPATPSLVSGALGGIAGKIGDDYGHPEVGPIAGALAGGAVQAGANTIAKNALPGIANRLGGSASVQDAGEALQQSAMNWNSVVRPAREKAAWDPLDSAMSNWQVPLTNTTSTLQAMSSKGKLLSAASAPLQSDKAQAILDGIEQSPIGQMGVNPSWQDVREFRSLVGQARGVPELVQSIGDGKLSKLYAAVTQDLSGAAGQAGQGQAFAQANATSTYLNNFAKNHLDSIIGPSPKVPGKLAASLLTTGQKDSTALDALRAELPDGVDELAAAHLRANGLAGWAKLNSQSKAALVTDAGQRASLDRAVELNAGPRTRYPLSSNAFVHESIGSALGVIGNHFAGSMDPALAGALGMGAGYAVPAVLSGGKTLLRNPGLTVQPAIGATAGANALFPDQAPSAPR